MSLKLEYIFLSLRIYKTLNYIFETLPTRTPYYLATY